MDKREPSPFLFLLALNEVYGLTEITSLDSAPLSSPFPLPSYLTNEAFNVEEYLELPRPWILVEAMRPP
jgi:hypothetical protein